uniref:DNA-directed RNA polymerase subunit beta' n=1 Tax=Pectinodesmus pectinatus TaxID=91197 RepID=A0A2H4FBX1_9CHLO|nr:RNA polymerase beta' subunit [Pectinodesmus pectinatus]AOS53094.1 RNA polymerase beta' subunit [Pectinodesmus pectinatus]
MKNARLKKNFIKKKLLHGYSKIHELKLVTIGIASPEKIQSWAEKELPNGKIFGEVTNANTFHYRTFKPSKGGLFCERIFGPIKDFECACGKRQKPTALESKKILEHEQTTRSFCPNCDVEYTWSIIRRYQLGYIKLNAPVAHQWYFKTNPSYLSILFDMKRKHLESIIYCTEPITIENIWKYSEQNYNFSRSPSDLYLTWQKFFTMEEKIKKNKIVSNNKQKEQKQKKRVFHHRCFEQKSIHQQINWKTLERERFFSEMMSEEFSNTQNFSPSAEKKNEGAVGPKTKKDILLNISKQKRKKFILFLFEQSWKMILQRSYKNALFFTTSTEFFAQDYFETTLEMFEMFYFSSFFLCSSFVQEEHRKQQNYKTNPLSIESTKSSSPIFSSLEYFGNGEENKRKSFWKSYFFLFQFGNFFLHKKKTKRKLYNLVSKTDIVFLMNILPFLKKMYLFKDLKYRKQNSKKIHDVLLQKTFVQKERKNKFEIHYDFSRANKVYSRFLFSTKSAWNENSGLPTETLLKSTKPFVDQYNFSAFCFERAKKAQKMPKNPSLFGLRPGEKEGQNKVFCDSQILFRTNRKNYSLSFNQLMQTSLKFEKMVTFLNYAYKVEFCSVLPNLFLVSPFSFSFFFLQEDALLMNKIFPDAKNKNELPVEEKTTSVEKNKNSSQKEETFLFKNRFPKEEQTFSIETFEGFLNQSETFFFIQKYSFEYFSFFHSFLKSHKSFLPLEMKKNFYTKNFKIQKSFFSLLKYMPFCCMTFSKKSLEHFFVEEQNGQNEKFLLKTKTSSKQILHWQKDENKPNQNQQVYEYKFPVQKRKMQIYNKPLLSRMKLKKQKKQLHSDLMEKFFHFDAFGKDVQTALSKGTNFQGTSLLVHDRKNKSISKSFSSSYQKQKSQGTKKLKTPGLLQMKINHQMNGEKKTLFSSFSNSLSKKSLHSKDLFRENYKQKEGTSVNHSLKNSISTIAYNYSWSNDADWKYFVYYNSFFFYDFEDLPIFLYRSFSPLKSGGKAFMMSEINSSFSTSNKSFKPFLSWSIDSSSKNFFVGAGILEKLLTEYTAFELRKMTKQHQVLLPKINQTLRFLKQNAKTKKDSLKIQKYFQKREHILRRLKFLRKFSRRNSNPTFMILRNLPVLPPDLRPILKLQNQIAASDLNRFYQRIIYRNDRLKKFSKDSATNQSFEIKYAQRLLQEAVDNLIQNGKGSVKAETNSRGQPLKSLSEILKGKQGRFRQYLLGKRVDYSGRSVIVVGPELKLYECGIPKEMALELFLPFLIQYILKLKLAQTVVGAKNLLKSDDTLTLHLLQKVMKNIPVLLNRAPTLHRLGFQAFLPRLIDGRAILLHPMVCPAFNADFDGDQMAVHIPLTVEARTEAWKFMLSMNNLMNSATGESIILPSQDMVLGCYYLTLDFQSKFVGVQLLNDFNKQKSFASFPISNRARENDHFLQERDPPFDQPMSSNFINFAFSPSNENSSKIQKKSFLFFKNFTSVLNSYQRQEISLHTPVWLKWNARVDFGNDFSKPLEIRLQMNGYWEQIQPKYTTFYNQQNKIISKCIRTTPGRILMNFIIQECARTD